jgi:hypothetical protein
MLGSGAAVVATGVGGNLTVTAAAGAAAGLGVGVLVTGMVTTELSVFLKVLSNIVTVTRTTLFI